MSSELEPLRHPLLHAPNLHTRPIWCDPFLVALAVTGNVTEAAKAAGVGRRTANDYRNNDAAFALDWKDAVDEASDLLEQEMHRRAVVGVDEPVYGRQYAVTEAGRSYQISDGQVGTIRRYSDTLLIFALKGSKPSKYRDNSQVEQTGEIVVKYVNDWRASKSEDEA